MLQMFSDTFKGYCHFGLFVDKKIEKPLAAFLRFLATISTILVLGVVQAGTYLFRSQVFNMYRHSCSCPACAENNFNLGNILGRNHPYNTNTGIFRSDMRSFSNSPKKDLFRFKHILLCIIT